MALIANNSGRRSFLTASYIWSIERMKSKGKHWSRDELIVAFNLYCRIPFGRIHKANPDIIELAKNIGRTPSAAAMKMVNFASLDPVHRERSVKGLQHSSKLDEHIWEEFHNNWEGLAFESQQSLARLNGKTDEDYALDVLFLDPDIPTEVRRMIRVRLVQRFFRDTVLSSYNYSCTVCEINLSKMLNASHIIPWSIDKSRRADPTNGLSLCVFHDRAFDRGLISVDNTFRIILSKEVKIKDAPKLHRVGLLEIEGKKIRLPDKFMPDQMAFTYHREKVFLQ